MRFHKSFRRLRALLRPEHRPVLVGALAAVAAAAILARPAAAQPGLEPETAAAADAEPISLGQVLQIAVRQSPALELASIDIAVADARILEASGIDDWLVRATAAWSSARFVELGFPDLRHQVRGEVELSRSLSTGGVVTLGAESSYSGRSELYTDSVSVSVYQPLLRGRGKAIARANVERARLSRDAAELEVHAAATDVVRSVIDAYWNLAYALRDLEIRRSSLALAEERLRITRAGIEGGAVAPTEALAVEQVIATREEEILAAEINVAERSIELRRRAGMEIGPGHIELSTVEPPAVDPTEFDLDSLLASAYAGNPEIAVLEKRQEGAELEVSVTENGLLPRLDFSAGFGPSGIGEDAAEALRSVATFEDLSFSANLTFEHSIGNRTARGVHEAQQAELYRAKVSLQDVRAQVAAAIVRAVKLAESARQRMDISQRAISLAEQNIDAEKARFELGRSTNFDVLQRQEELKQAQLRYARAVVDYLQGLAVIDSLTGELLGGYGITMPDGAGR